MTKASDDHCRQSLRLLAEGYAAIVAQYERTIALLEAELSRSSHSQDDDVHSTAPRAPQAVAGKR